MKRRRLRNISGGTEGSSTVGGDVWLAGLSRDSWVEKYPELATRADLLQAMGVPPAVTIRSRHGDPASILSTERIPILVTSFIHQNRAAFQ